MGKGAAHIPESKAWHGVSGLELVRRGATRFTQGEKSKGDKEESIDGKEAEEELALGWDLDIYRIKDIK